jgi:hypothetical protein
MRIQERIVGIGFCDCNSVNGVRQLFPRRRFVWVASGDRLMQCVLEDWLDPARSVASLETIRDMAWDGDDWEEKELVALVTAANRSRPLLMLM